MTICKIGFGGGCHWCTEAYFQALNGVVDVAQGWIAAVVPNDVFSEAVMVQYDPEIIPLQVLIAVHLHTHAATAQHALREKYRSAVYVFDGRMLQVQEMIAQNQCDFDAPILTQALPFASFRRNIETQKDYYQKNKTGVFCQRYIAPKLEWLQKEFPHYFKSDFGVDWTEKIQALPMGYSSVSYKGMKYGVTRTDFNQSKSTKVFAQELGGNHFISFNYYATLQPNGLKPCEMPREAVLDFLYHYEPIRGR